MVHGFRTEKLCWCGLGFHQADLLIDLRCCEYNRIVEWLSLGKFGEAQCGGV